MPTPISKPPGWLEPLLVDPDSGAALQLDEAGDARGATGPVARNVGGVLRFAREEAYAASFGEEWTWFSQTQLDRAGSEQEESATTFVAKTGWPLDALEGKLVLDAGCGMGRFADVASRAGARVVGVDLSVAVEAAHRNIGSRENVALLQTDLMRLPLRPESFDLVFSIGVLHHTPDTRRAFERLPPLLRPGGELAVWVYSGEPVIRLAQATSDLYRLYTRRMDRDRLLRWCRRLEPIGRVYRTRWGMYLQPLLPLSAHPRREWRILDNFDWYSPRYQWKHRWAAVESWFHEAGLVDVHRNGVGVAVAGRRPTGSPA